MPRVTKRDRFLGGHPGLAAALECEHRIVRDIAERFARFGTISEKQVALVMKLAGEAARPAAERPIEQHTAAPEGRATFTGTVVSAKEHESPYGVSTKLTVKVTTESTTPFRRRTARLTTSILARA